MKLDKDKKEVDPAILEQLFEDGYVTREVDIIPKKLTAVIKNLSSTDQILIEKEMSDVKGSGPFIIHTYSLKILSVTLLQYGKNKFSSREETEKFLTDFKLSSIIIDKLVKLQSLLEKEVREALNMETIDKVFFAKASPQVEQKQSQKDTNLVEEAVLEKQ